MPEWTSFAFYTFSFFFPVIDPFGNLPVFNALTADMSAENKRYIARKSCFLAVLLTLGFAFLGETLFDVFHLTMDALKIVGGIIFFLMGFDMLNARMSSIQAHGSDAEGVSLQSKMDDIAISPLAVPLLVGPGAITNSIILMDKANDSWLLIFGFVVGVLMIFGLNFICFVGSSTLARLIGENGNKVILRLMGLFLMIMAVNYFFEGLTPMVRNMLQIPAK